MRCPVCKQDLTYHTLLESQLPAYQCSSCEGNWLSFAEYLRWVQAQGTPLPEKSEGEADLLALDSPQAKLCPECGHFLIRYNVLPHTRLFLDRCSHCNGVWFDRGEWQALVDRNMHDKVNQFFTSPWQTRLREEETHAMLDKLYLEKFGAEDYAKVKQIWDWLIAHPRRSMLLAYLESNNPYKI